MTTAELTNLLRKLMEFDSTSGNEQNVANYLAHWLKNHHYHVDNGELYIYAKPETFLDSSPIKAILCSHLDTVPPYIPYSELELDTENGDTIIYGRGSCDAKGQVVSLIGASLALQEQGVNTALLFTYGEETEHCGIKQASQNIQMQADIVIVGEPTELKLMSAQKGCISGTIETFGLACHSGYPEYGDCALTRLMEILLKLKETPELTFNSVITHGGKASNVVPAYASADFTVRSTLSCDRVKEMIGEQEGTKISYHSQTDPVNLSVINSLDLAVDQAGFVTDLAYLEVSGNPLKYLIGPGSIRYAHTEKEHIKLSDIFKAVDIYIGLVKD